MQGPAMSRETRWGGMLRKRLAGLRREHGGSGRRPSAADDPAAPAARADPSRSADDATERPQLSTPPRGCGGPRASADRPRHPRPPSLPRPRSRPPAAGRVVCNATTDGVACPCCGAPSAELATGEAGFAGHVFECRLRHSADPSLPIVWVAPSPSPPPQPAGGEQLRDAPTSLRLTTPSTPRRLPPAGRSRGSSRRAPAHRSAGGGSLPAVPDGGTASGNNSAPTTAAASERPSWPAQPAEDAPAPSVRLPSPSAASVELTSALRQLQSLPPIVGNISLQRLEKSASGADAAAKERELASLVQALRQLRQREQRCGEEAAATLLKAIERAVLSASGGGSLDVSGCALRGIADIPVLAGCISAIPGLRSVALGEQPQLAAEERDGLRGLAGEALLAAVEKNGAIADFALPSDGAVPLEKSTAQRLAAQLGAAARAAAERSERERLSQLAADYADWSYRRQQDLRWACGAEHSVRSRLAVEEAALRRQLRMRRRRIAAQLQRRQLRSELRLVRQREREALSGVEAANRTRNHAIELGDLLWLVVVHEGVNRSAETAAEYSQRRAAKGEEEAHKRGALQRLRERLAYEAAQRWEVEGAELEARGGMAAGEAEARGEVASQAHESWRYIEWLEDRRKARRDFEALEWNLRLTLERDEHDARRCLMDNKRADQDRLEAALQRDRDKVHQEELKRREEIMKWYDKWAAQMQEEVGATMHLAREQAALQRVEEERDKVMGELPELRLDPSLGVGGKPFVYFVHPSEKGLEPPTLITATATANWTLPKGWADRHRVAVERVKKHFKLTREIGQKVEKIQQRNKEARVGWGLAEEPPALSAGEARAAEAAEQLEHKTPSEAPQGAVGRGAPGGSGELSSTPQTSALPVLRQSSSSDSLLSQNSQGPSPLGSMGSFRARQNLKALQHAVKVKRKLQEETKGSRRWAQLSSDQLAKEKAKVWGGCVEVTVLPDEAPEWIQQSEVLRCKAHLDLIADDVRYEGSGDLTDLALEHPRVQFELPVMSTYALKSQAMRSAASLSASFEAAPAPTLEDADSWGPGGRTIRVLLAEESPQLNTPDIIARVIRSCTYQCTGHGLQAPMMRTVLITVRLLCAVQVDPALSGARPPEQHLRETSATMTQCVVLAVPFIAFPPRASNTMDFAEGQRPDEVPILRQVVVTDPPTITRSGEGATDFTVMPGGQQGGGLSLTNFSQSHVVLDFIDGYTRDDVVCFRPSSHMWLEHGKVMMKDPLLKTEGGTQIGTVISGLLPTCGEVAQGKIREVQPLLAIHFSNDINPGLLVAENLKLFLRSLRFANTSTDPTSGVRHIRIQVGDRLRYRATVDVFVSVTSTDNPTEIIIPNSKLQMRPALASPQQRQWLYPVVMPIAPDGSVKDVDTDRFCGGSFCVTLSGGTGKGEGLAFCVDPRLLLGPIEVAFDRFLAEAAAVVRKAPSPRAHSRQGSHLLELPDAALPGPQRTASLSSAGGDSRRCSSEAASESGRRSPSVTPGDAMPLAPSADPPPAIIAFRGSGVLGAAESQASPMSLSPDFDPGSPLSGGGDGLQIVTGDDTLEQGILGTTPCSHGDVVFEGRIVGRITKGSIVTAEQHSHVEGCTELMVELATTGAASIKSVEALLRRVVIVGSPGPSAKMSVSNTRNIDIELCIGPTVQGKCEEGKVELPSLPITQYENEVTERVTVRHAPALLSIPEKFHHIDYREGSGAVRLAPFEVMQDKPGFVSNYNSAWILVEILQGAEADDALGIREEDQIKLVRKGLVHTTSRGDMGRSPRLGPDASPGGGEPHSPRPRMSEIAGSLPRGDSSVSPASPAANRLRKGLQGARTFRSPKQEESSPNSEFPAISTDMDAGLPTAETEIFSDSSFATSMFPPSLQKPGGSFRAPAPTHGGLKERMREKLSEEVRDRKQKRDKLAEHVRRSITVAIPVAKMEIAASVQPFDVAIGQQTVAEGRKFGTSALCVRFKADPKGDAVTRRHVLTILRNISYQTTSADPVEHKVIRVILGDGPTSMSQCIIELTLQSVDNVTEIRLLYPKITYCPLEDAPRKEGPSPPFCICPYGQAKLHDPDTAYMDGGSLVFTLVSGGAKGDHLALLTPEQQQALYGESDQRPGMYCSGAQFSIRVGDDGRQLLCPSESGELVFATQDYTYDKTHGGCTGVRFSFLKDPGGRPLVPLALATWVLNCITFVNSEQPVRLKPTTRTYAIKVSDGSNPVDGKARLQVDSVPPMCVFLPHGSFSCQLQHDSPDWLSVFDGRHKLQICIQGQDTAKPPPITRGYCTITLEGDPKALLDPGAHGQGDGFMAALTVSDREQLQLNPAGGYVSRDGWLYGQNTLPLAKLDQQAHQIHLEFNWSSKITGKMLQQLARAVQYRCKGGLQAGAVPLRRIARLKLSTGGNDPYQVCTACIEVCPPGEGRGGRVLSVSGSPPPGQAEGAPKSPAA